MYICMDARAVCCHGRNIDDVGKCIIISSSVVALKPWHALQPNADSPYLYLSDAMEQNSGGTELLSFSALCLLRVVSQQCLSQHGAFSFFKFSFVGHVTGCILRGEARAVALRLCFLSQVKNGPGHD